MARKATAVERLRGARGIGDAAGAGGSGGAMAAGGHPSEDGPLEDGDGDADADAPSELLGPLLDEWRW
jgi:hypothetical protein